ncbi:hypothetical protein ACFIOY_18280 [Bradyrhizobium sp. TZ2]
MKQIDFAAAYILRLPSLRQVICLSVPSDQVEVIAAEPLLRPSHRADERCNNTGAGRARSKV